MILLEWVIFLLFSVATFTASKIKDESASPSFQTTLDRYDVDGDGLEQNEVEATVMRQGFQCLDTDNSGRVSKSEWSQLFERYTMTDLYGDTAEEVSAWLQGCKPLHQMGDLEGAARALKKGNVGGLRLFKLAFREPWRLRSDFGLTADDADLLVMAVCGTTKGRPCGGKSFARGWLATWWEYLGEKIVELISIILPVLMIFRVLRLEPKSVANALGFSQGETHTAVPAKRVSGSVKSILQEVSDLPALVLAVPCCNVTVHTPKKLNIANSKMEVTEEGIRLDRVDYYKFERHEIRHVSKGIVHGQHFQIRTRIGGLIKGMKHVTFYLSDADTQKLLHFIRKKWG